MKLKRHGMMQCKCISNWLTDYVCGSIHTELSLNVILLSFVSVIMTTRGVCRYCDEYCTFRMCYECTCVYTHLQCLYTYHASIHRKRSVYCPQCNTHLLILTPTWTSNCSRHLQTASEQKEYSLTYGILAFFMSTIPDYGPIPYASLRECILFVDMHPVFYKNTLWFLEMIQPYMEHMYTVWKDRLCAVKYHKFYNRSISAALADRTVADDSYRDEESCPVCFNIGPVHMTQCKHILCYDCMDTIVTHYSPLCPVCRCAL